MNRSVKKILGVTLLEIMLVLAVAAMVIIMSIKYYQSSNQSEQVNVTMSQIQAIGAAMDSIGNGGAAGGYATITTSILSNVIGSDNLVSATNSGSAAISGTPTATSYVVTIPLTTSVCTAVGAKLIGMTNITGSCTGSTVTYTYTQSN